MRVNFGTCGQSSYTKSTNPAFKGLKTVAIDKTGELCIARFNGRTNNALEGKLDLPLNVKMVDTDDILEFRRTINDFVKNFENLKTSKSFTGKLAHKFERLREVAKDCRQDVNLELVGLDGKAMKLDYMMTPGAENGFGLFIKTQFVNPRVKLSDEPIYRPIAIMYGKNSGKITTVSHPEMVLSNVTGVIASKK